MKRKSNQIIEKSILKDLYIDKEYSISMIEKELNLPRSRIESLFKLYNINKKTQSEIQKSPIVKHKKEQTSFQRYGVVAGFADDKKRKKTKKEKYGNENYCNSEKAKQTCIERYGKKSYLLTDECKNSLLKKYNVPINIFQSEEIKQKSKITKKEKYGNENYNNVDQYKKTCLNHFGVDNPSKSEIVKNKKIQTSLKNYGVEFPWQTKEIKKKIENVMIKKYGVKNGFLIDACIQRGKEKMMELYNCEYGFQNNDIQNKIFKNSFRIKEYKFRSGRITYVMGYENIMLDILIKNNINEDDLLTNMDCPIILWEDNKKITHKHIPDIYVRSENKIIEVKSEYTASINPENILLKKKYGEMMGFVYKIYVIDKKLKAIKYEIN